ncbi:hypothetical protein EDB80DRAFT_705944 [Ilyonectria destructans]|nr:hypothetical protein EDB80DRAFT_705944 [Ilyonectria destructans]
MSAMPAIIPRIAVLVELSSCTALLVRWTVQHLTYHSAHPEKTQGFISSNYFACLGTEPIPAPLPLPWFALMDPNKKYYQ